MDFQNTLVMGKLTLKAKFLKEESCWRVYALHGEVGEHCIFESKVKSSDEFINRDFGQKLLRTIRSKGFEAAKELFAEKILICVGCGILNEYAVPNMQNGSYKCYSCVRGL